MQVVGGWFFKFHSTTGDTKVRINQLADFLCTGTSQIFCIHEFAGFFIYTSKICTYHSNAYNFLNFIQTRMDFCHLWTDSNKLLPAFCFSLIFSSVKPGSELAVLAVGGGVRNKSGHWQVGCYQADLAYYRLQVLSWLCWLLGAEWGTNPVTGRSAASRLT